MYLTWEQLDACNTSSEIAGLLRKNYIQGIPGSVILCPLARATNSKVGVSHRYGKNRKPLTRAERTFVNEFDHGKWQELSIDS